MSLLTMPGKAYGKILIDRVQSNEKDKISNTREFRIGSGCVDQTFHLSDNLENVNKREVFAAFMDLKEECDKTYWEVVWDEEWVESY